MKNFSWKCICRQASGFVIGATLVVGASVAPAQAETLFLTNTGVVGENGKLSYLYLLEIDEVTGTAEASELAVLEMEFADALACTPNESHCYVIDKYDAGTAPDGGALGVYDTVDGTFEIVGDLVDGDGFLLDQVVMASFSPGPTGELYVGSQTADMLYTVDVATAIATPVGEILVEGTESTVNLDGADMVFTADSRVYVWTNGERLPDAPNGLYEITLPVDGIGDATAIYLGVGSDGADPESHRFTGLAVRDNGLGNIVGSNRFDELHEQDAEGADVAVYEMMHDGELLGHGSGDMHHSFDCFMSLDLVRSEIARGGVLEIDTRLVHNRPQTSVAAPMLWVEDAAGEVVFTKVYGEKTFHWGDDLRRTLRIDIPEEIVGGDYTVWIGLDEMRQGRAAASASFTIEN